MIIRDLRLHHALFRGNLPTLVCQQDGGKARLVWERPNDAGAEAAYLIADAATYEILGMVRGGRHYFKPDAGIAFGARLLLVPMAAV